MRLDNVQRLLKELDKEMKKLGIPKEVLEKEIKPFGNASHVVLPKKYSKKKAKIIIKR